MTTPPADPVQEAERLRVLREWLEIAKLVPQMTEKRCEQLVAALRYAESQATLLASRQEEIERLTAEVDRLNECDFIVGKETIAKLEAENARLTEGLDSLCEIFTDSPFLDQAIDRARLEILHLRQIFTEQNIRLGEAEAQLREARAKAFDEVVTFIQNRVTFIQNRANIKGGSERDILWDVADVLRARAASERKEGT
jgi:hypothetical protein